jgi:mRNA-degrading endonuclease RelE of RelBE toxin-antitoxin system
MIVEYSYTAAQYLECLEKKAEERIIKTMLRFAAEDTLETKTKKLQGFTGIYRVRIGVYRVLVTFNKNICSVIAVDQRKDVYRKHT